MKVKKIVSILLITLMCISVFVGCGKSNKRNSSSSTSKENKSSRKVTTITFGIWDKNQQPGMRAIADKFQELNPGIKVTVEVTPWSEYWTKLEAAATGGAMPDVFWMHTNEFVKYAGNEMLMEVGPMVEKDPKFDFANYPKGLVDLYTLDGKIYAIPKDFDTIALFYNKKIFDEAGIVYPDDTWDWNKLVEVAKQLTNESKGIWGFGAPYSDQEGFHNTIYQNGGYVISDDKSKSGFDLPETIGGLQYYIDMVHKYKVSPTQEQFTDTNANAMFAAGKIAMLFRGSWQMSGYIQNEDIKDNFDLTILPKGKKRASIYNGLGYAGSAKTKHPEEVKKFLRFLGTEEANIIQAKNGSAIPAYHGTQQYWIDCFKQYNVKSFVDMLEYAVPIPTSKTKSKWTETEKDIVLKMYANEVSVEEGCKVIADAMNELLATEK